MVFSSVTPGIIVLYYSNLAWLHVFLILRGHLDNGMMRLALSYAVGSVIQPDTVLVTE